MKSIMEKLNIETYHATYNGMNLQAIVCDIKGGRRNYVQIEDDNGMVFETYELDVEGGYMPALRYHDESIKLPKEGHLFGCFQEFIDLEKKALEWDVAVTNGQVSIVGKDQKTEKIVTTVCQKNLKESMKDFPYEKTLGKGMMELKWNPEKHNFCYPDLYQIFSNWKEYLNIEKTEQ